MISDIDMLALLSSRENYDNFYPHIKDNFLTREGQRIGEYLAKYYHQDEFKETTTLEWGKFGAWFLLKNQMMPFDQKENMKTLFKNLEQYEPKDEVFTRNILTELTTKSVASEISNISLAIADGSTNKGLKEIDTLLKNTQDKLDELEGEDDRYLVSDVIEDEADIDHPKLEFSMPTLRKSLGPCTKGDMIIVAAYPETGKTTFIVGEAAHMVQQLPEDMYVLYFNNEQGGHKIKGRIQSSLLQMNKQDVIANPVENLKKYKELGGPRILLYDKGQMSVDFIESKLKKYEGQVGLVIIDQLWKVRGGSKSTNDFMQLAHIFAWARDICKTYAPLIAVHQASEAAYNKKYVGMDSLFGSRIALQGEGDGVITIGRMIDGSQREDVRHFYVAKNHMQDDAVENRNPKFDAFIDGNKACYREV